MTDYHATQLTGTPCAPYNCAAASGAMGVAFGSGFEDRISADAFRAQSGVDCRPGGHSASGGLFVSDVERVFALHHIAIDYGRVNDDAPPMRWPPSTLATRLRLDREGAVVLGDYDALPAGYRASATFKGNHSAWVHDYAVDGTVCWHDPLRKARVRIPISAVLAYWQKPLSAVRGLAGFVKAKEEDMGTARPFTTEHVEGTFTVDDEGTDFINPFDDRPETRVLDVPVGTVKHPVARAHLKAPLDDHPGDRTTAYQVSHEGPDGKPGTFLAMAANGTFLEVPAGDTPVELTIGGKTVYEGKA